MTLGGLACVAGMVSLAAWGFMVVACDRSHVETGRHPQAAQEFQALARAEGRDTMEAPKEPLPPAPPPHQTIHQKLCALCGALPKNQFVREQVQNMGRRAMCTTPKISGFGHHVSLADCVAIAKFKAEELTNE